MNSKLLINYLILSFSIGSVGLLVSVSITFFYELPYPLVSDGVLIRTAVFAFLLPLFLLFGQPYTGTGLDRTAPLKVLRQMLRALLITIPFLFLVFLPAFLHIGAVKEHLSIYILLVACFYFPVILIMLKKQGLLVLKNGSSSR